MKDKYENKITGYKQILVAGPSWVGDMVMAQSLFMELKAQYPEAEIDVLAPSWSLPVLMRMPQLRQAIVMPVGHRVFGLRERFRIGKTLRKTGYDLAIVIPRSWKSALTPYFARIAQRTGYRGEMRYGLLNDIRKLDKTILKQTVQRYVALGRSKTESQESAPAIHYPVLEVDSDNQKSLLISLELNKDRPVIAFMPGAEYGKAKCWPVENFAALAEKLVSKGAQVWLMGSAKDDAVAQQIMQAASCTYIHNLCGRTQLEDVIDLLALSAMAITNDSGLMHIAAAVDCQVVAIYGSSTPAYTPPLSDKAKIMYLGLECSPCFKRECPFGHYNCLKNISVDDVVSICEKVDVL